MSYTCIQAIREGAGLLNYVKNETPAGTINGSNKDFIVVRRPIVDGNYDDVVDIQDVNVYVDRVLVDVAAVDSTAGKITLVTAPATGTKVTVDYQFSPISDKYVEGKQTEAESWINTKLRPYTTVPLTKPIPGTINTIAELYAAGLILTRDWGNRVDTEQTSKDGAAKIKMARELLNDHITGLQYDNESTSTKDTGTATMLTDADPFQRASYDSDCTEDDLFMRRQC